ncbi:DnaJ sub C member 16 [Saguinus oedipus]|uniref:DnaJ sub C member 16 n=1 Tax=Saguinus oedipus TaxID=9490 RepID=A0ABQ9V9F8_SAGOE|nr:DnaJ sub C member 16 [Saguinus oedipus]
MSNFVMHPLALIKYALGSNEFHKVLRKVTFPMPFTQFLDCNKENIFGHIRYIETIRLIGYDQILSNEEKRSNYDQYGDAGENQGYQKQQQQREYRFRHFHENFYFDESFFHFPFNSERRDSIDEKYLLHFSHYVNEVVPDSFKKPYLIKITSDWCFSCIHIEPVWKEVVQELEELAIQVLSVGIGVVHAGYERRLAHHLGAHSTPSILGIINGKISFFHNAVVRENLRQFVESLLPGNLVEKVTNKNYVRFLSGWQQENKPHVLLFDQMPVVPLLYKVIPKPVPPDQYIFQEDDYFALTMEKKERVVCIYLLVQFLHMEHYRIPGSIHGYGRPSRAV